MEKLRRWFVSEVYIIMFQRDHIDYFTCTNACILLLLHFNATGSNHTGIYYWILLSWWIWERLVPCKYEDHSLSHPKMNGNKSDVA